MIVRKQFGSTGHMSTRLIFGATPIGRADQPTADKTIELLLEYGVNHIDVAAGYSKGVAERRLGPWMSRSQIREKFFLATKTSQRTYQDAKDEFHSSLERLKVDRVDMLQLHNLVNLDDWNTVMGARGALEALIEAREEELTRFIGVTGHGMNAPGMHLKSLARFDFDSVLLPLNHLIYQDQNYAADFDKLVSVCREKGVAVQTIKAAARRPYPGARVHGCWYEPLLNQDDINRSVNWVLSHPDVFLISAGNLDVLSFLLKAANNVGPKPSEEELRAMEVASEMSPIFDGTKKLTAKI
jgi:predicted aldo/keto reductase-like oxidoreductase